MIRFVVAALVLIAFFGGAAASYRVGKSTGEDFGRRRGYTALQQLDKWRS